MASQTAQKFTIPLDSGINLSENRSHVKQFTGFVKKNGIMYNDALSPFKYELDEGEWYFPLENGGRVAISGSRLENDNGETVADFDTRGFGKARFSPVWLNKDVKGFDKKDDVWCYVSQSGVVDFTINIFKNNSVTLTKSVRIFGNVAHVKFYKTKNGRWLCFVYCVLSSLSRTVYVCDIGNNTITATEKTISTRLTNLVNVSVTELDSSGDVYFSLFSKSINGYEGEVLFYSGCYTGGGVLDVTYNSDNKFNLFFPHIVLDDGRIYSLTKNSNIDVGVTTFVPTFVFRSSSKTAGGVTVVCIPLINEKLQSITGVVKSASLPSFALTEKYYKLKYPLKVGSGGTVTTSGQSAPASVTITAGYSGDFTMGGNSPVIQDRHLAPDTWSLPIGNTLWTESFYEVRRGDSVEDSKITTRYVNILFTLAVRLTNPYTEDLSVYTGGVFLGVIPMGQTEYIRQINCAANVSVELQAALPVKYFKSMRVYAADFKFNGVSLGTNFSVQVGSANYGWSEIGKNIDIRFRLNCDTESPSGGYWRYPVSNLVCSASSIATEKSVTPITNLRTYTLGAGKEINLHVENGMIDGGDYNSDTSQVYLLANGFQGGGENKLIYDSFGSIIDIGENFRVMMNNAFISGISYGNKGSLGSLLVPMYTVDDTFFPLVVSTGEKKSVLYKATDGLFYEIWHDNMQVSFRYVLDRYILFNTTSYLNALDLKTGNMEHIGHDYNNRCLLQGLIGTKEIVMPPMYMFGSAVNASYETLGTAFLSTIYNTQPLQGVTTLDVVAVGCNSVLDSIDIYGNRDGNQAMYEKSVFFQSGADYIVYERSQLSGTSYPNNTDGNIICAVSMFAEIGNSYFKNIIVKENEISFLLLRNETMSQFAYLFGTQFGNIKENFVIQGMSYGISDNKIYSLTYDNGVVANYDIIADITGLQYLGCLPSYALFWSVQNRHFYIFTGANILQKAECASRFNEITATYYNTGTQVLYLVTDKGVCMKTETGSLIVESDFIAKVEQVFFVNSDYILLMLDNGMMRLRYTTSDTSLILPLDLETEFYGMGNNAVGVVDSWQITLLKDDKIFSGDLVLHVDTLTDRGMQTEEKVFKITEKSWDRLTGTMYIRFQPRYQQGMGMRLALKSPFPITQLAASYTPMATQISRENV